jgi:F-type H+-transporting ATPase subunit gamma
MQTLESIKNQLENAADLYSVVKTMKAIAAVSIRQYEEAVRSVQEYNRCVVLGLQIVLKKRRPHLPDTGQPSQKVVIVYGSEQGMCGQFNDNISAFTIRELLPSETSPENLNILTLGSRIVAPLQNAGLTVDASMELPGSVAEITQKVQEVIVRLEKWRHQRGVQEVLLFFNKKHSGASYEPYKNQILPLDSNWLQNLRDREWPTNVLPHFTMSTGTLFRALIRQYIFVSLYQAFAESLASENASRLAAMQAAENNIEQRLNELNSQYNHQRQNAITAELLDIVSGFEALHDQESGPDS